MNVKPFTISYTRSPVDVQFVNQCDVLEDENLTDDNKVQKTVKKRDKNNEGKKKEEKYVNYKVEPKRRTTKSPMSPPNELLLKNGETKNETKKNGIMSNDEESLKEDATEERETWGKKTEFLLSVIGFAVDLGNVWRFPYICYRNGGGAFLLPYFIMLIFLGLPLFYMELALGQYQRCGAISIWNRLCPMFTGLGYGICFVATFVGMYYNTVIAWAVYYLFASFRSEVPWSHCNNTWNTANCVSVVDGYNVSHVTNDSMLAATEFYLFRVLEDQKAYGIERIGSPKWQMVLCLIAVFVIVYFSLWKGIKSSGKAVWVTATVPYVVLLILLVRGCTLPGAKDGIIYYLRPQWDKLLKVEVWLDAASQIFFSLGPGFGTLLALSSYNKFHNNCYIDAVATATINCFTSVLAGFVVFSVLGYMAHITQKDIDKVAMEGPGLVFMVYPEALATLDGSVFWSILFFVMLITLGMDSTFGGLEAVITAIMDTFAIVKGRREWLVLGVIIYCFLGSLPSTTNGGQYIVSLIDRHAAPIPLICICFCEAIAVNWFYGVQHFSNDVQSMLGFQPGIFWKICWAFICPICLIVLFVLSIYYYDGITLNGYVFPQWSLAVGWTISSISLICIPIYIVYLLIVTPGTFKQKILRMIRPSSIPSHVDQDTSRHLYDKYEISSSNVGTTVNTPVSYNAESISMYSPYQVDSIQDKNDSV
ncbi:sodium-dependent serotonin transporter-like [Mytilus californianus]|uniref:sodium-dependent serotonin transporter-like n=1 Tax=Mytilus californianus TaxID=6549 RepID=UPI002247A865|nr:sodium-dependent serotonin transporter-like [Mytilus californianus]